MGSSPLTGSFLISLNKQLISGLSLQAPVLINEQFPLLIKLHLPVAIIAINSLNLSNEFGFRNL